MADIEEQRRLADELEESAFRMETQARHAAAIHASDIEELRRNLSEAARRFDDLAALIETDGVNARNHTGFMRASAKRYRRVLGEPSP